MTYHYLLFLKLLGVNPVISDIIFFFMGDSYIGLKHSGCYGNGLVSRETIQLLFTLL